MDTLLRVLHTSLSISVPPFFYRLVEDVLSHSVRVWEEGGAGKGDGEKGESMEESGRLCVCVCVCVCLCACVCLCLCL